MTTACLPHLRRKRRIDLPKLIGRFSEGVAEIEAQVELYAQRWDDANHEARHTTGPLWIVLGDSSTQGIGASRWELGWPHIVLERLRQISGDNWRLVNLAMSGGRFADVSDRQIPVLNTMLPEPQLVTCVIGSNDLMWRRRTSGIFADAKEAVDLLPNRTLVSRLNGPGPRPAELNKIFEHGSDRQDHRLFNIWDWPSGRGALAADRVHPSDVGYGHMADLAWTPITAELGL